MSDVTPIHLSIPAEPAFARTVRMMAANLAVLCGMSVDDVEDMRMAAEESFVWCCATKPATCEIDFSLEDGIAMELGLGQAEIAEDDQASVYAELILSAVCDEYSCDRTAGTLSLKKRTDSPDA